MKKNKWLIEKYKQLEMSKKEFEKGSKSLTDAVNNLLPELYACVCKVLIDKHGWEGEEVAELFAETQELWNELVANDSVHGMVNWCEETTGVSLRSGDE